MAEKRRDILVCLSTGLISILIFCIVTHIWNMDLNIPFVYAGDFSGLLNNVKTVLREESWWNFTGMGAPFHTNMWRQLMDGYIPNAIIYLFAKMTQSAGCGINLYYIISYGLSAMCTYYMLRKSMIKPVFSFTGAVLYALIPGHILRSENHLYVGSCFTIPLIIVTAVNLFEGRMCKAEYASKARLSAKELIKSNSKEQFLGLFFLILVSLCTIYYGIFALMLLTFCAVYCSITQKQWRHLYYYFQYVLAASACIIIIYIPSILANIFDPCIEKINIFTRSMGNVETYAGKLIQYILPIGGHRIPFLANIRNLYDTSFWLINENGTSSLGLVMSVGFLIGLLACFFHKEKLSVKIETYGKVELFLLLLSTVGGLSAIVGMINYSLRCYNRFSYFIGAVGIIISMKMIQECFLWFSPKLNNRLSQQVLPYVIAITVLIIGIFDQTTTYMAYTRDYGTNIKLQYENDADFVHNIELFENEGADVLVFPVMNAQQSALSYTKDDVYMGYGEQMLFAHSNTSNWSTGGKAGEPGERWLNWLETFDEKTQVEIAAIVGFSGIAICYEGYTAERLETILADFDLLLGDPVILHKNGTWAYYSLSRMQDKLLLDYTDDELNELKNKYLYDYSS